MNKTKLRVLSSLALAGIIGLTSCGGSKDLATTTSVQTTTSVAPTTTTTSVKKDVTVSFNTNGGNVVSSVTGKEGDALTLPTPTLAGYSFVGWFLDEGLTEAFSGTTIPASNVTLYAKWNAVYHNVTVHTNNGQASYVKAQMESHAIGVESPTLEGATFAGWFTTPTFDAGTGVNSTDELTGDITLYAKWNAEQGTAFVSATGTSEGTGSMDSPLDVFTALEGFKNNTEEGLKLNHIYLLEGTYNLKNRILLSREMSGSYDNVKVLSSIAEEPAVLNFSEENENYGIYVQGNYFKVANLVVEYAKTYGMYISGSNNLILGCETRFNTNTGLGIAGSSTDTIDKWPTNNLIKNCTSHDNYDYNNGGEDADGFSCKLTNGQNNVFDGCISYANSDDGFDLYAKNSSGNTGVTKIINCIAFRNGFMSDVTSPSQHGDNTYTNGRTVAGDGNGFKLGGEVMYDNVYLENCIAFENGANGYTDNSNPGVIRLKNCTSYNNALFALGKSANFNVARTVETLNTYEGLLSICTNNPVGSENEDSFRGPISNSVVIQNTKDGLKYFAINDVINGNSTIDKLSGKEITLDPETIFASTDISKVYVQTVESANSVHKNLRNADGSVNLGDYLKVINEDILTFANGSAIGGNLSATEDNYPHYETVVIPEGATADEVKAYNIYQALTITCDENAVYENIDLYKQILGVDIVWSSSNENIIAIDTINVNAKDAAKKLDTYFTGVVYNPYVDTVVTITATWKVNEVTMSKTFDLNVKALTPVIGEVEGLDDQVLFKGETYIADVVVYNINGRNSTDIIDFSLLNVEQVIVYSSNGVETVVPRMDTNIPGVYTITYTFTVSGVDYDSENQMTYGIVTQTVEVINPYAKLEIAEVEEFTDKVVIDTSWKEGTAYAVVLPASAQAPTADFIKAEATKASEYVTMNKEITDFVTELSFGQVIYGDYLVYVTCENVNGLSDVQSVHTIVPTYVTTAQQLHDICVRTVGEKEVIILENDIDFTDYVWEFSEEENPVFRGVFNGNGHKIMNLSIAVDETFTSSLGMINNAEDARFENVILENFRIESSATEQASAFVVIASNSIFENIHMTNVAVSGFTNVGTVLGYANTGDVTIRNVSLDNAAGYEVMGAKKHVGGIVGCFMGGPTDDTPNTLTIENVYVNSNVTGGSNGYTGGVVGRVKDNSHRTLIVTNAVVKGTVSGNYSGGIVGGGDKNGLGSKWILTNCISYAKITTNNANCGTIYGRIQGNAFAGYVGTNTYFVSTGSNNKASKAKDNANTAITLADLSEQFYLDLGFDLVNTWVLDEQTNDIKLK